jgi:hypothetical protein
MAADVQLLNRDAQHLLDELQAEFQKDKREALVVYQTPDGEAHYRRVGFAGAGKFRALGMLIWAAYRVLKEIEG